MSEIPIKVLVVDDHLIIREGLRLIFDTIEEIEVIGEAQDGLEAIEQVNTLQPDVVLMDLMMPRMDGITAIEELRKQHPELAIIILTTYQENDLMLRGLAAGARGYLLKDTDRGMLLNTIQAAARGEVLLSPELMQQVLKAQTVQPETEQSPAEDVLSDREVEVLQHVAKGERNKEIAYHLGITERTVKAHLTHIYQKLQVDSRAAAVAEAGKRGMI